MTDSVNTFEDDLVDRWRANGGVVTSGPLTGHPLLVMTSAGARSGKPRRAILTFSRNDSDYVVAGTASGSKKDPAWLANLLADPNVTVEAEGQAPFKARASVVDGAERDRLWDQHVATLPHFAAYPEQAGRVIPMVRLTPKTDS